MTPLLICLYFDSLVILSAKLISATQWPYVMRDEMLFAATIALSRFAWLISRNLPWREDPLALRHMCRALTMLRERAKSWESISTEEVIFTIARFVTMSYMMNDDDAFAVHFTAFRQLADNYVRGKAADDARATMVYNRLQGYVRR
jgi:hypothetical protein